jgi:transcriptional regulator with XRE-family HTH domain
VTDNVSILSGEVKHTFAERRVASVAVETTGDRIRVLREARGWTQEELGERLDVSRASVSQWERGETKNIKNLTFLKLVGELNTTAEYLLFGRDGAPGADRGPSGRFRRPRSV